MKISILTLFPQMFEGPFDVSIIKRARDKNLLEIEYIDIREFGIGKHRIVDDKPYGGGLGMILKVDVLKNAISSVKDKKLKKSEEKIILMSAKGESYNHNMARKYSKLKHLIIICGHYEGVDERIINYIDEQICIGEFVTTGGEIPAMLVTDSVVRLIPGVLKKDATVNESFTKSKVLEYPQYTRPEIYDGKSVPKVLLKGNHGKIAEWKIEKKKIKN